MPASETSAKSKHRWVETKLPVKASGYVRGVMQFLCTACGWNVFDCTCDNQLIGKRFKLFEERVYERVE